MESLKTHLSIYDILALDLNQHFKSRGEDRLVYKWCWGSSLSIQKKQKIVLSQAVHLNPF